MRSVANALLFLALTALLSGSCCEDEHKKTTMSCATDNECGGGVCYESTCFTACTGQDECAPNEVCVTQTSASGASMDMCADADEVGGCTDDSECNRLVVRGCEVAYCELEQGSCQVRSFEDGTYCVRDGGGDGVCGAGRCLCQPDCAGIGCGSDGCGGSCGACRDGWVCQRGLCVEDLACVPSEPPDESCDGLDNDCDGQTDLAADGADPCPKGDRCLAGTCVPEIPAGGFAYVPPLTFWMGSPEGGAPCPVGYAGAGCTGDGTGVMAAEAGRGADEALHYVGLTRTIEVQVTEVSQAEWTELFSGWNPSTFPDCGGDCPVESITWFDALVYANALSREAGLQPCYVIKGVTCSDGTAPPDEVDELACMNDVRGGIAAANITLAVGLESPYTCLGYRLPTEAEWELAARAGSTAAYANGQDSKPQNLGCELPYHLTEVAWYCANNAPNGTKPVAGLERNDWGLWDMSGNVAEWCWDHIGDYPDGSFDAPAMDPQGASGGGVVFRGGSWANRAEFCRAANRSTTSPDVRDHFLGCRLVRTVE